MTIQTTILKVKFPKLIKVSDYHEFDKLESDLDQIFGKGRIKVEELSCDPDPWYTGIIYTKKDKEYRRLKKVIETIQNEIQE